MENRKTSDAQRRATKKWEEENPERRKYLSYRSSARTFVRHWATDEDFEELEKIFKNK